MPTSTANSSLRWTNGPGPANGRDEVRRNGLGGVDPARLERSIDEIAEDFRFRKRPAAGDIFDGRFLPPVESRLIN